jgi:type I restriction enzyme S subunit
MSVALTVQEPSAKYLVQTDAHQQAPLMRHFDVIAQAPGGVARLRELILTLAVQGKLVAQDPKDEPASVLLKEIRAEKDRLIAEGKIKRDKPVAEIADEEKPFGLPRGWEWVRFGDASINRDGERIPVSSSDRDNLAKTYDYYGASGVIDKIDGFLFDKTLLLIGEDGANLINRSTPIAFLAHGKYWVNNHAHVIDTTHPVLMTYLALFINAISLEQYVTGTAQPKMNQAKLNSIVIALPPLAEQSRIVTRVEELMRLCDALEAKGRLEAAQHTQLVSTLLGTLTESETPEQLAENWQRIAAHFDLLLDRPQAVDALEQTILQLAVRGLLVPQDPQDEPASALLKKIRTEKDLLIAEGKIKRDKPLPPIAEEERPFALPQSWGWVRIDEVAEVQGGIQKTQLRRPVKEHHPYLRVANVQRDALRLSEIERFELTKEELAKWRLKTGDLLVVEGNGSADEIGRCAVWDGSIDPCVYQNHLIRVRCLQQDSMAFLKLFLNAPSGMEEMKRLAITTSGLYNLSVGKIRNFVVPIPSLAEQSRIVTRVNELRALCADLRERLSASQSTQAHLAEALIGEAVLA